MKIGYIFPGQGTQTVGMGKDIYDKYEEARNVYKIIDKSLNENIEELTYKKTQEELNKIVQERLDKEKKKMPSKEDLKAFKDWKESQKTAEEKQAEKEAEYQKTLNELNTLKQTNAVLEAGVNKDDVDYVLFKVSKMEGDFDENLTKFLKDNPKYKESEPEGQKATGTQVKKINSQNDGVLGILASKHPDMKFD